MYHGRRNGSRQDHAVRSHPLDPPKAISSSGETYHRKGHYCLSRQSGQELAERTECVNFPQLVGYADRNLPKINGLARGLSDTLPSMGRERKNSSSPTFDDGVLPLGVESRNLVSSYFFFEINELASDPSLVMIVSYETLRNLATELNGCKIGLLLCDEGHRLKNSGMSYFHFSSPFV